MKRSLGPLETQVLAYAQMRQLRTVRSGELARSLRLSNRQEREVLSQLSQGGLIARVRRGLYLLPPRLPVGGSWSPDAILALNTLMEDRGACYQICGPNAFNRYGFDEQVSARLYVYNNRLSGDRTIGSVEMTLIRVTDARLGGTEEVATPEGMTAVYSSRVRTLVDAVYDWSRFSSLPRGYEWIRRELSSGRVTAADLARTAAKYSNQGTLRRIGLLLEQEGASRPALTTLQGSLRSSASIIPWNPAGSNRGPVNRRWGVILNETP
jgi:predicted transcriptional regulator of viral defense system